MSKIKLGPWPAGLDNVSDDTRRINPETRAVESLRDAIDVTIDRDGWADSRPGRTLLAAELLHSLWTSADGTTYGGRGAALIRYDYPSTVTELLQLPTDAPIAFTDMPVGVMFTAGGYLGEIREGAPREAGVPDGSMFTASAIANGGLAAGQYAVAIAYVDAEGREGGLSQAQFVNVPAGGGLQLDAGGWPDDVDLARVYRTKQNGDSMYLCATVPYGMTSYLIGAGDVGRMPMTQHLRRMVGGTMIAYWSKGRVLTATRTVLRWSEALAHHLYSPRHNWLALPATIRFIAPVEGGVWVGHSKGVAWLAGTRPNDWAPMRKSAAPPIAGTAVVVAANELPFDLDLGSNAAAVWLSEKGYCVGSADGRLIEVQAKRVRVAPSARACTLVQSNRLTAFTQ